MRIALLHPFSWPKVRRGGERYAHDLAWWLTGQGHEVDFITGGDVDATDVTGGARMVRLAPRKLGWLERRTDPPADPFGSTVFPWLKTNTYDVVHSMHPAATLAAVKAKHRVVFSAIGHPEALRKPSRVDDRKIVKQAMEAAAVTTALSASAADVTFEVVGVRPRVLHPGLRLDVFTPNLRPRTGAPTLLFAADVADPRKRLNVVLDAMPAVLDELPTARVLIGGPGELPTDVDPRVRAALDTPGVGSLDDVAMRFRSATLTVLPSVNEAFGLVLVESMASGTPVVAVRSGGIPEVVTNGVGCLAAPDEAASLARAIIDVVKLAADPETPRRCTEHASQWGWDIVGPQHLAAYADAMAK